MNVPLDRYLEGAMYIPEEKGLFAADPFLIPGSHSAQDGPEIVFERFDWRSGKGHIATVRATQHGRFSPPTSALELSTHLSYPFVLEHDGVSTILPESCEGGKLVEYVLDPSGMSARAVRDHGEAVTDPTIVFHNGRYWMFYCRGTKNSELCIRHAQDSNGPWTEHVLNPVKIDVCNARPAGSFLQYDGQLYRPAQICAPHYGLGIVFNKIVRLDETSFSEEPVASIVQSRSGRYRHGVHTIAREGDTLVFDHARLIFSPREAMRVLSAKFGKLFV